MKRGFTLIELLVSLGLFAVVMVICMGSILTILDANTKAQSASAVMTNLQVALDGMTREMRTGEGYSVSPDGKSISFVTQDNIATTYAFQTSNGLGQILKTTPTSTNLPITADEVNIDVTKSSFSTTGTAPPCDKLQPKVFITITGVAGIKARLQAAFNIQTTVSQRFLDAIVPESTTCS